MLEYIQYGESVLSVPNVGRRVTVYRGQKTWEREMVIEAAALRQSTGSPGERETWTKALLTQFRNNITGTVRGDQASKQRLEGMLLNAQHLSFQNPFVSCSFSYNVARSYANAGDTLGYVLVIEGPWYNGIDFGFIRNLFGLYADAFDYLQEYGLPERLEYPFTLVRVDKVGPWNSERVFP